MSREEFIHRIEVHVASIILHEGQGSLKILVGKRNKGRSLFPSYWECGGGQVHKNEDFYMAVRNQVKDEFGIEIEAVLPVTVYKITTPDGIIPGVRFVCKYKGDLSGVRLNEKELVEHKWISETDLYSVDLIPGLREDIINTLNLYRKVTS